MPNDHDVRFTDRELDVMQVLWDRGSATVSDVQEALADELAYTTVLTILRTLDEKGHVRHESEGRAYRWFPCVERAEARSSALRHLLDRVFAGNPEALLTHLVAERDLTAAEIERMRWLLAEEDAGKGDGR